MQDALLNAWHKRRQYKHDAQLETWIHRIAIDSALQLMRQQQPSRFTPLDSDCQDHSESAETRAVNAELATRLDRACEHLSEMERICFTLKHLEEWRLKEIADDFERLRRTYGNAGFTVLGVSLDDEPARARALADAAGVGYPVLSDAGKEVARTYRVDDLPLIVLVDRNGVVRARPDALDEREERGLMVSLRDLIDE